MWYGIPYGLDCCIRDIIRRMEKKQTEGGWAKSTVVALGAVAVLSLVMLYGFSGMFLRAYHIFAFAEEEDMSFGWFVPLFSIYVLWTQRSALVSAVREGKFSWAGFAASLPFFGLALLGTRGVQVRLEIVGFIGLCITIPWTFFGWRCAKVFLFPAGYLMFCIPLATFLDFVTIHLRYLASSTALSVLNGFGMAAVREGTAVISRGAHPFAVDVAEPCSGLRSLFALMALTAGYAYFNQPTWLRRGILFASSIPLAVAGNVARIVSICVIAACTDPKFATGFYHDYSGYIVFIVAITLMVVVGELIDRIGGDVRAVKPKAGQDGAPDDAESHGDAMPYRWSALSVVVAALFCMIFVFQARTPPATIAKAPEVSFPVIDGFANDDDKYSELQKISEAELNVLPKDTSIVKKMYVGRSGAQYLAAFVIGGTSRASIHRPELCLPSQGYVMSNPRNFNAGGRPWHAIDFAKPGGSQSTEAYTFFNQEGYRTASHTRRIWKDVLDRSVLNRVDRWVMLTVHATGSTEEELKGFLNSMGAFE